MTFQEIADERLGDASYDWAIPQEVFNQIIDATHINPGGHIVWLYDETARIFGRPFGLTLLGGIIIKLMGW